MYDSKQRVVYQSMKDLLGFLIVSLCWGATNPFIKRGSAGVSKVSETHPQYTQVYEFLYLVKRWQYMLPVLVNLSGSSVFYYLLGDAELTLAVPITNALSFVMTFLVGYLLGEELGTKQEIIGIGLILAGVILCVA